MQVKWDLSRIFRRLDVGKTEDQVSPVAGDFWSLNGEPGDPFPSKYDPVKIREVKAGWVRYDIGRVFKDQRRPVSQFVAMYTKVKP